MSVPPSLLLIPAIAAFLALSGYGLAGRMSSAGAAERLAAAALAGLGLLWFTLGALNFFVGLEGFYAWLCLWPLALTATRPTLFAAFFRDVAAVARTIKGRVAFVLGAATLLLLIWPELTRPSLLFYDGTSSHDGYFWIAGAKHLQAHSYMEAAPVDADRPWANLTHAFAGWRPMWGRAGTEGLLALCASLSALDPVQVYLPVTAALFTCWIAAVYLVARTFWLQRLSVAGVAVLFALQPLFVFYRANGNLPNLLGALTGATAVVALAHSVRAEGGRWPWWVLLALSVHGTLFAYPEIAPFIALPGVFLLGRAFVSSRHLAFGALLAVIAGIAANPATAIRAYQGFAHAFKVARANVDWIDTFERLRWPQYPASLATLSLPMAEYLGPALAGLAGALLLVAAGKALLNARDRYGASATLSGCAVLIVYTLLTDFTYGWQKSAQFAGVFIAALLPVAAIGHTARTARPPWLGQFANVALAGSIILLFATAMVFHTLEIAKWSGRRGITQDWIELQAFVGDLPPRAHIRVEPATFPMSFFHGMWATYFLRDVPLSFGPRGDRNGGYLHETVVTAPPFPDADATAILVGREWAQTFDANSPRLFSGNRFVLLSTCNAVVSLAKFLPQDGVPTKIASGAVVELRPHSRSELHLTLVGELPDLALPVEWRATTRAASSSTVGDVAANSLHGPWNLIVPLAPGELHRVEFTARAPDSAEALPRFKIAALRIVTVP